MKRLAPARLALAGWLLKGDTGEAESRARINRLEAEMRQVREEASNDLTTATHEELLERMAQIEADVSTVRKRVGKPKGLKKVRDPQFLVLAAAIAEHGRTLLQQDRLWILWQAVKNTAPLGLAAAEVGSYRGGSAFFIASAYLEALGREAPLHVIDTFEGHPGHKLSEEDSPKHQPGLFSGTSYVEVAGYLRDFALTEVHQGEFSEVAPTLPELEYGFVHLDVDLYEPTLDALRYFGPRLATRGAFVVDDYEAAKCPGIKAAITAFLKDNDGYHAWNAHTEQMILVKCA